MVGVGGGHRQPSTNHTLVTISISISVLLRLYESVIFLFPRCRTGCLSEATRSWECSLQHTGGLCLTPRSRWSLTISGTHLSPPPFPKAGLHSKGEENLGSS